MKKTITAIISFVLVLSLLLTSGGPVFAAAEELYLSDLRIIYANSYDEAKEILAGTDFKDYTLLRENLNENTKKIGVWLAYKTTTDIEDAITDISVMQMNGGYNVGNYQEMLKQSYAEYLKMGEIYLQAIEYFTEAYDSGDYFAKIAHRQLNFYTVKTDENTTQKPHPFEGELLGDIFYDGIALTDLATLFMQGNSYALQNIRSLLAMGVSYNDDGKTYMEKVADAAAAMNEDPTVFDTEEFAELLPNISSLLTTLRPQFKELEGVEGSFNWEDNVFTEEELQYSNIAFVATLLRDTAYLGGKTLYEFCMEYTGQDPQSSSLYPLAAALNPGQAALTKVFHYYDVIRYSISDMPEDIIEEQLAEMESTYAENPFNVYAGVDRSIFDGSFALTTAAYRANNMNEYSLEEILFGDAATLHTNIANGAGVLGLGITVYAICRTLYYKLHLVDAAELAGNSANAAMVDSFKHAAEAFENLAAKTIPGGDSTYGQLVDRLISTHLPNTNLKLYNTFSKKVSLLDSWADTADDAVPQADIDAVDDLVNASKEVNKEAFAYDATENYSYSKVLYGGGTTLTAILYVAGGIMMLYSAITMAVNIYDYYHPEYDDIPTAMVDMIDTVDGDRYIKYDAVLEAEAKKEGDKKGICVPGDLNAFSAQRWNALYFTKSYEAGKPLLADEFVVSSTNHTPKSNYAPVRRFGEAVCYNLNKYNFNDDHSIYLSVKQSKNQKAAVADVPEVVGSVFSDGLWLLIGSVGALVGIGGTLITTAVLKKKRAKRAS